MDRPYVSVSHNNMWQWRGQNYDFSWRWVRKISYFRLARFEIGIVMRAQSHSAFSSPLHHFYTSRLVTFSLARSLPAPSPDMEMDIDGEGFAPVLILTSASWTGAGPYAYGRCTRTFVRTTGVD